MNMIWSLRAARPASTAGSSPSTRGRNPVAPIGNRLYRRLVVGGRADGPGGFTMIEIAISLAVIGFAMVAIIGILPTGMNVQRVNRQETIINQDASVLIDAFRSGARGADDLTNYFMVISNFSTLYNASGVPVSGPSAYFYTPTNSTPVGNPPEQFLLTNGSRIIGLLGTPTFLALQPDPRGRPQGFYSNHVVAFVRSMSGLASEKFPQTNSSVQELSLNYRLIVSVTPRSMTSFAPQWTNFTDPAIYPPTTNTAAEVERRSNYWAYARTMDANLHDLRLTFRWPLQPNGDVGPGRQVFRTQVSGWVLGTNEFNHPPGLTNLFFFQLRSFEQVKAP